MPPVNRFRIAVFPASDSDLLHDVLEALQSLPAGLPEPELRDRLIDQLRPWYRSLEVVIQNDLAHLSLDSTKTWYVYRDKRVRRPSQQRDRLYAALAAARRTSDASREALNDAQGAARFAGYRESGAGPVPEAFDPVVADRTQSTRRTSTRK